MKKLLLNLKNKKFMNLNFLEDKKNLKIWRSVFVSILLIAFIIIFIISILNNGLRFVVGDAQIIINETLLKTLCGFICGFGLTTAGAAMQSVTRNELAGPTTLGFMPAALIGIMIYQVIPISSPALMIFLAFIFSFIIFMISYLAIRMQKKYNKNYKIILIGVIIGAFITTISSVIITYVPQINQNILPWIGTITTNISWTNFYYCAPLILIGILLISIKIKTLNLIESDKELAKSLGVNYELTFWMVGIGSILITVSSVILIGSITMIGIVIPHLMRMLFRTKRYEVIIPLSGLFASTIVMFALWINSLYTLGLNIFTSVISTPLFLYIIFRRNKYDNN